VSLQRTGLGHWVRPRTQMAPADIGLSGRVVNRAAGAMGQLAG
jgi:hypothetical protein